MDKAKKYDMLVVLTNNAALMWRKARGVAPDSVADKLDNTMLEWQTELTKTLKIWIDKGLHMTNGELILARANLGAVVESWLKFFYTVYYEDYLKTPLLDGRKNTIEPEKLSFENLKNFSKGKLWDDINSADYKWVNAVQSKRNAIHSFQYKDIGTPQDFIDDVECLYHFADKILFQLPPIEDSVEKYPDGYVDIR